jgi:hypothetical protein
MEKGLPEVLVMSKGGYIFWAKKCCGKCAKSHGKEEMQKGSDI